MTAPKYNGAYGNRNGRCEEPIDNTLLLLADKLLARQAALTRHKFALLIEERTSHIKGRTTLLAPVQDIRVRCSKHFSNWLATNSVFHT